MIKAVGQLEGHPVILFGLSHANLGKLKEGLPIKVNLEELGLEGVVWLVAGETEEKLLQELIEDHDLPQDFADKISRGTS